MDYDSALLKKQAEELLETAIKQDGIETQMNKKPNAFILLAEVTSGAKDGASGGTLSANPHELSKVTTVNNMTDDKIEKAWMGWKEWNESKKGKGKKDKKDDKKEDKKDKKKVPNESEGRYKGKTVKKPEKKDEKKDDKLEKAWDDYSGGIDGMDSGDYTKYRNAQPEAQYEAARWKAKKKREELRAKASKEVQPEL